MRILLLGRKHIAKSEDILAALKRLGHNVDFVLFSNFHYTQEHDAYEASFGKVAFLGSRSRKSYYLKHFFRIFFLMASRFRRNPYDTLLAIDWFEGCILLVYKHFFARKAKMIFYSYDYYFFDSIFSSRYIINRIDRWVASHADEVWNVNDSIRKERESLGVVVRQNRHVPLGVPAKLDVWVPENEKSFLFVGNLKTGHNLSRLVEAFSVLSKENPDFKLTFIGKGNEWGRLSEKIKQYGLEKSVFLRGFVDEETIAKEIACGEYACGIALYEKTKEVACVDPGKVKDYLSWNLPVLMTSVNEIAEHIREYNLGKVASSDDVETLTALFKNISSDTIMEWQRNIQTYVLKHSFDAVLRCHLTLNR